MFSKQFTNSLQGVLFAKLRANCRNQLLKTKVCDRKEVWKKCIFIYKFLSYILFKIYKDLTKKFELNVQKVSYYCKNLKNFFKVTYFLQQP